MTSQQNLYLAPYNPNGAMPELHHENFVLRLSAAAFSVPREAPRTTAAPAPKAAKPPAAKSANPPTASKKRAGAEVAAQQPARRAAKPSPPTGQWAKRKFGI